MSTKSYHEVLDRVRELDSGDQLRLLEELAALVRYRVTGAKQRSILDLQGLGKGVWNGVDAQDYIDRERGFLFRD